MFTSELQKVNVDKSINYQWLPEENGITYGYAILLQRDRYMTKVSFKVFKAKKIENIVKYTAILKLNKKGSDFSMKEFHLKGTTEEVCNLKSFLENYEIVNDKAVLSTLIKEIRKL